MEKYPSNDLNEIMDFCRGMHYHAYRFLGAHPEKREEGKGFRFRVCDRRYPGSPDLVLPKYNAVIFVNGCFWHAHENCSYYRMPKSNVEFWQNKFTRNKQRDAENLAKYQDMCWRVCTVWECAIRGKNSKEKIEKVTEQIIEWLDESAEAELLIRG